MKPFLIVGVLLAGLLGGAAPGAAQPSAVRFEHLGTADGLSQSIVYDILQDREGYLWFGTRDGLNRYDGYTFKVYRHDPNDPASLSDSKVWDIFEDDGGTLWIGTIAGGLNRFDRRTETFTRYRHDPEDAATLSSDRVSHIAQDSLGMLWIATEGGGLNRVDPTSGVVTRIPFSDGDSTSVWGSIITALYRDRRGVLWAGTSVNTGLGLCQVDLASGECTRQYFDGPPYRRWIIKDIGEDAEGRLWIGMGQHRPSGKIEWRLTRFDPETGAARHFPVAEGGPSEIVAEASGAIWFGGTLPETHLYRFDPVEETVHALAHDPLDPQSLSDGTVQSILVDRDGALWVGTERGLNRLRPRASTFALYRSNPAAPTGLRDDRTNGLFAARDGALWVGTNSGLHRLDRQTGAATLHVPHLPGDDPGLHAQARRVWTVHEDRQGTLWIGTGGGGLQRFDPDAGRLVPVAEAAEALKVRPDQPLVLRVRHLAESRDGTLWIGTDAGMAWRDPATGAFSGVSYEPRAPSGLMNRNVNAILEDAEGRIWAGTDGGLYRFDRAARRFSQHFAHDPDDPASLSANIIWSLAEDPTTPGVLWVATVGGGLNRFDLETETFRAYTTADGLPSNTVYAVLSDGAGTLWASTGEGLAAFDVASETFVTYSSEDDLQGVVFDLMAYHESADGELFFGGPNGFIGFRPDRVGQSAYQPPVVLTGFRVLDAERPGMLASGDEIVLSRKENFFTLHFAALDFTNPERNRYRYRLDGFDPNWRTTDGTDPKASYTNVPPGRYTFVVEGSNHHGVFGGRQATLRLRIVPAFWQTGWFQALMGLLFVGGVVGVTYAINRRRLQRVLQKQAEEREIQRRLAESRDRERVRIAHDLHDGPIQDLYTVGMHLDALSHGGNGAADPSTLDALQQQLGAVADDLRDVCSALRPPVLVHFGLGAALADLAAQFEAQHPEVAVALDLPPDDLPLPEQTSYALYRICQEALHNVGQHAAARRATIRLRPTPAGVLLEVEDDGRGFAMPAHTVDLVRRKHYGLAGMIERAEALGGTLGIAARRGGGTRLHVVVPAVEAE